MSTTTVVHRDDIETPRELSDLGVPEWIYRYGHIEGPAAWRTTIAPALIEALNAPASARRALVRFAEQTIRAGAAQLEELDAWHAELLLRTCEDILNTPLDVIAGELVEIAAAAWDLNSDFNRVEE